MWSQCRNLRIPLQCRNLRIPLQCRNLRIPLQSRHGSCGTSGVSPGASVLVSSGGLQMRFPPELSQQFHTSLRVDQGICGFPSRLSHEAFPQGCPTCHSGVSRSSARKSRQCRENRLPWNGLRHLGDSGNGDTILEFLSPFLWRAHSLEMRRERREFFPDHAGKESHLSG